MRIPIKISYRYIRKQTKACYPASCLLQQKVLFILAVAFCSFALIIPCFPAVEPDDFDTIYDSASNNYRRGNYEQALKLYKKANTLKANASLECLWGIAQ